MEHDRYEVLSDGVPPRPEQQLYRQAKEHDRYEVLPDGVPPRPPTSRLRPSRLMGSFRQNSVSSSLSSGTSRARSLENSSNPDSSVSSARSLNVSNVWVSPQTSPTLTRHADDFSATLRKQASDGLSDDEDPHERVHKTTTISAFVTFLKALFGVSLLFQPRILGETGLILGTLVHVVIMSCCAFACYLLLMARQIAVADKESRDRQADEEKKRRDSLPPDASDGSDAVGDEAVVSPNKNKKSKGHIFGVRDRFITYGDLVRQLMGRKLATIITSTIFVLHILFAAGMVAGATRNLMVLFGWLSIEEGEGGPGEEPTGNVLGGGGQLALTALIFPLVLKLLLIRNLSGMFLVSAIGLIVYFVGCVGSMVYSAATFSEWEGGPDAPQDMWEWKWEGIPAFVASTVYAIEGINLALPTANNIVDQRNTVPLVSGAILLYGLLTLAVAWVGYIGGLGGGPGTRHGEQGCHYISYCLSSTLLSKVHELSLSVALLVTLPVILYPSTELLEVWDEERRKEIGRRKKSSWGGFSVHLGNYTNRSKLFLRDKVDTLCSTCEATDYLRGCVCSTCGDLTHVDEAENVDIHVSSDDGRNDNLDQSIIETSSVQVATEAQKAQIEEGEETDEHPADIMDKHFRLRLGLALVVCAIGALEVRFYSFITFVRGLGLSFAGFCLPPTLYFCAARGEGKISPFMLSLLSALFLFGLFTMVLAFIPSFTDQEYMHTQPQ